MTINKVESNDRNATFEGQLNNVKYFYEVCDANAGKDFLKYCTREILYMLCDFMKRCVQNGYLSVFPQWTFIISEFHLFVIEVDGIICFKHKTHNKVNSLKHKTHSKVNTANSCLWRWICETYSVECNLYKTLYKRHLKQLWYNVLCFNRMMWDVPVR